MYLRGEKIHEKEKIDNKMRLNFEKLEEKLNEIIMNREKYFKKVSYECLHENSYFKILIFYLL
jgi:hypothetical protein